MQLTAFQCLICLLNNRHVRDHHDKLVVFQQLKILEVQINTCFRRWFLPVMLISLSVTNILSTFLCILNSVKLFSTLEHNFFLLVSLQSWLIILSLGTLGGMVNKKSAKLVEKLSCCQIGTVKGMAAFRKKVMSLSTIEIKFGSNFLGILTPLVLTSFCVKWTTRLLFVQNK